MIERIGHFRKNQVWDRDLELLLSDFISFNKKKRSSARLESKRGKLYYRGTPIYEDYAPEVLEQHSKYKEVLSELYKLGLKPTAVFPARLTI